RALLAYPRRANRRTDESRAARPRADRRASRRPRGGESRLMLRGSPLVFRRPRGMGSGCELRTRLECHVRRQGTETWQQRHIVRPDDGARWFDTFASVQPGVLDRLRFLPPLLDRHPQSLEVALVVVDLRRESDPDLTLEGVDLGLDVLVVQERGLE